MEAKEGWRAQQVAATTSWPAPPTMVVRAVVVALSRTRKDLPRVVFASPSPVRPHYTGILPKPKHMSNIENSRRPAPAVVPPRAPRRHINTVQLYSCRALQLYSCTTAVARAKLGETTCDGTEKVSFGQSLSYMMHVKTIEGFHEWAGHSDRDL